MAFYQWQIIGFGNPIYLNTSYAYFTYPNYNSMNMWLVQLITMDSTGCLDTTTQQLLLRDAYNTTASLNEMSNIKDFSIFPNPASDNINIETTTQGNNTIITIYNLHGQQLMQCEMKETKTQIDISSLAQGMYFVKIESDEGIAVRKIVKE
jgi:hypothetical protein